MKRFGLSEIVPDDVTEMDGSVTAVVEARLMDTVRVKEAILLLLLEHQEQKSHRMWLDAKAIGDAVGLSMTAAATLLGSDLAKAGLVRPVPVPNEPPSWAGYYALTEQGTTVAERLKDSASDA